MFSWCVKYLKLKATEVFEREKKMMATLSLCVVRLVSKCIWITYILLWLQIIWQLCDNFSFFWPDARVALRIGTMHYIVRGDLFGHPNYYLLWNWLPFIDILLWTGCFLLRNCFRVFLVVIDIDNELFS